MHSFCKADFQPRVVRGRASRGTVQNMKKRSPSSQSSQLSADSRHKGGRQEAPDHRRGRQLRSLQHQQQLQEREDRELGQCTSK